MLLDVLQKGQVKEILGKLFRLSVLSFFWKLLSLLSRCCRLQVVLVNCFLVVLFSVLFLETKYSVLFMCFTSQLEVAQQQQLLSPGAFRQGYRQPIKPLLMVELPNLCPCRKRSQVRFNNYLSFVSIFGLNQNQKKSKAILRCTPNGKHWLDFR